MLRNARSVQPAEQAKEAGDCEQANASCGKSGGRHIRTTDLSDYRQGSSSSANLNQTPKLIQTNPLAGSFASPAAFRSVMLVVRSIMRYLLAAIFLFSSPAFAQAAASDSSPDPFIQTALEHFNANQKQTYAYTYLELWHNQNFDKRGRLKANESAKFESVFIDDMPYLRKIEEDGEPLTGRAARREEKKYEAAVRARKGMTLEQKQAEMRAKSFSFPFELGLLPTLYDNRIVGTEILDGRPAIHIDCTPRAGIDPKNEEESNALRVHLQVWIDVQDQIFSRLEGELLAPVNGLMPGSHASVSFLPLNGIWLPWQSTFNGRTKLRRSIVAVKTDLTYSNFQKFRVDVRVLDNARPNLLSAQ